MPRSKKKRGKTKNDLQFDRTIKHNNRWRGKVDYKLYERKGRKPKAIIDKFKSKIDYRSKFKEKDFLTE